MDGGIGNDILEGGSGSDWLFGGSGSDKLSGGAGHDVLIIDSLDTIIDGGEGRDIAIVSDDNGNVLDLSSAKIEVVFGGAGDDSFDASGIQLSADTTSEMLGVVVHGNGGNDTLLGGAGDDVLSGGEGQDTIHGNDGDDLIIVDHDDIYDGGVGVDVVRYYSDSDLTLNISDYNVEVVFAGQGNDVLSTSQESAAALYGEGGDDTLIGGLGGDWLAGGAGNDTLRGGYGEDIYSFGLGDGHDVVEDEYTATGTAKKWVITHWRRQGDGDRGDKWVPNWELKNYNWSQEVDAGNPDRVLFGEGISLADLLVRRVGEDLEIGIWQADYDTVGFDGLNDKITLKNFTDVNKKVEQIRFADETEIDLDSLLAIYNVTTDGSVTDLGEVMADLVAGTQAGDVLAGTDGDDVVGGTDFNEIVMGRGGDDTLMSSNGFDTLIGGAGNDTVSYERHDYGMLGSLDERDGFGDVIREVENLYGSEFDDDLYGNNGDNIIDGQEGNDNLYGRGGDDTLIGGTDNNLLVGGAGADTLDGGEGIDTASYILSGSKITVELGERPDLEGSGLGGEAEGDVLKSIENVEGSDFDDTITGNEEDNILWGRAGADTLNGGRGRDTLIGGAGNDVIDGGTGSDTYFFGRGGGVDSITDAAGNDVLHITGGLTQNDLVLRMQGDDLEIALSQAGVDPVSGFDSLADKVVLKDWAVDGKTIETIRFNNGTELSLPGIVETQTVVADGDPKPLDQSSGTALPSNLPDIETALPSLLLDGTGDYLSRTPAGDGDLEKWTFSSWVKLNELDGHQQLLAAMQDPPTAGSSWESNQTVVMINSDGRLDFYVEIDPNRSQGGDHVYYRITSADPVVTLGEWLNVVAVYDSANEDASKRMRLYVNGDEITTFSEYNMPPQNLDSHVGKAGVEQTIGALNQAGTIKRDINGEFADVHFINGDALEPGAFGKENGDGGWAPDSFGGTQDGLSYHLDFADGGAPGKDSSGNGLDFTSMGDAQTQAESGLSITMPGYALPQGDGNDILVGDEEDNTLSGLGGADEIFGGVGDDTLIAGDVTGGTVTLSSAAFDGVDSALTLTPVESGANKRWTFASWVKLDSLGGNQVLLSADGGNGTERTTIRVNEDGTVTLFRNNGDVAMRVGTVETLTVGEWASVVVAYDGDADDAQGRVRIFINGEEAALTGDHHGDQFFPEDGLETDFMVAGKKMAVGARAINGSLDDRFTGELADLHLVDGLVLPPYAFGNFVEGDWQPGAYEGDHGEGGFHIDFVDAGALGADSADYGTNNPFSAEGGISPGAGGLSYDLPAGSVLYGGSGDDTLIGGAGDDTLIGGSGTDAARYSGSKADYTITNNGDGSYSVKGATIGTDTLSGIETVEFDDNGAVTSIDLTEESGPVGGDANVVLAAWEAVTHKLTVSDADLLEADTTEVLTYSIDGLEADGNGVYTLASGATVTFDADGNYTYNPAASGQPIKDSFTWRATDISGLSASGTVALSVGQPDNRYDVAAVSLDGSTGYLSRSLDATGGNQKTFTISAWVKSTQIGASNAILSGGSAGAGSSQDDFWIGFDDQGRFMLSNSVNNSGTYSLRSKNAIASTADYVHVVVRHDTTQGTASERLKVWIDGKELLPEDLDQADYPAENSNSVFNGASLPQRVGAADGSGNPYRELSGSLAEVSVVDGQALDQNAFGAFDDNNNWQAKEPVVDDFGTAGFHLDFSDESDLGNDSSGKGNDFTVNGSVIRTDDAPVGILEPATSLEGTDGNDVLVGDSLTVAIDGGAGDDLIEAGDVTGGEEALSSIGMSGGTSDYMTTTLAAEGNRTTWTFSSWVKRDSISDLNGHIFGSGPNLSNTSNSTMSYIRFDSDNHLSVYDYDQGVQGHVRTEMAFTDNDWHHITVAYDTTQDNPEDRVKFYVDGVEVGKEAGSQYPDPDFEGYFNTSQIHMIGRYSGGAGDRMFNGELAKTEFVDGQALGADCLRAGYRRRVVRIRI